MSEPKVYAEPATGMVYRLQEASDPRKASFLLFHGLSGDEKVMWVIESGLPSGGLIASPRAPFEHTDGGYSWVEQPKGETTSVEDFQPAIEATTAWIETLRQEHGLDLERTVLVGFSQGSALCFALAAVGALRPAALVALAGLLPEGDLSGLRDLPVFWGHGSEDEVVPVQHAHRAIERLQAIGSPVRYCEADVGHKVGVECMRGLKAWLAEVAASPD